MNANFINKNNYYITTNENTITDMDEQLKIKLEVDSMIMNGLKIVNKIQSINFVIDILIFISAIYTAFLLYFGFISITLYNNEIIPIYGIIGLIFIFTLCGILQLVIYIFKIPLSDIIDVIETRSEYNIYYRYAMLNNLITIGIIKNILGRSLIKPYDY